MAPDSPSRAADAASRDPSARATVLLVEDDADSRIIYATYLAHVGFAVLTAADAEAGIALAGERRPDLVVMDVTLPGLDGYAAARALRADARTRDIPLVALTGHASDDARARAAAAGFDRHLAKPLDPRALADEVRALLLARPLG